MDNRSLLSALSGGCEGWAAAFFGGALEAEAVLALAPIERRQLWCAVWAQMSLRAERLDQAEDLDLWRKRFQSHSLRSLMQDAGFGRARGLRKALGKLGWRALERPEAYLALADLLEEGDTPAKVIRHLDRLDARGIDLLIAMPAYARSGKALQRLHANRRVTANMLRRQCWRVQRMRSVDATAALALQRAFVSSVLAEADGEFQAGLPFPPAPWRGDQQLTPIDTPSKLESAGRRFFNCLGSRMTQVRQGCSYYYELEGVAVVEFERVSSLGWEVADALGPRNARPASHEIAQLKFALKSAPPSISRVLPDHLIG